MKLMEPVQIGGMKLRNRIVMPGLGTHYMSESGEVTERMVRYYAARARGGVGLIITEVCWVDFPRGKFSPTNISVDADRYIGGLNYLAESVQVHGARIALQLHHAGRQTPGPTPPSVSDANATQGVKPHPLTVPEIEGLAAAYGEAAKRAVRAGFDAVEIHGAHGFLIQQFMSPLTNHRTDDYGGSVENRARFALKVVGAIRQAIGARVPIIFRLCGDEYLEGGLKLADSQAIARLLEKAGVNALNISAGSSQSFEWTIQPAALPRAALVHLAEGIKKVVNIPVIAVGSINDPLLAEDILVKGKADLIAMGRPLVADPELPNKVAAGRFEDIRPCIRCNRCIQRGRLWHHMHCAVSPATGREIEFTAGKASVRKHVVVVGGGPAGMEAAVVASSRGHKVTLVESAGRLGGQLNLACIPPHKDEMKGLLKYMEAQVAKSDVAVKLGTEATPEKIKALRPDTIILASGAKPCAIPVPVSASARVVQAWDVLDGKSEVGTSAIILGGGTVGAETAEFLAQKGKTITIVEMLDDIALDMEQMGRSLLIKRLKALGVVVVAGCKAKEVTGEGVLVSDKTGDDRLLKADTVVLSAGCVPNDGLVEAVKALAKEVYLIGDCRQPRKLLDAIYEGWRISLDV